MSSVTGSNDENQITCSEVEPNENRVFRPNRRPFVTEINMAEYGDGRSTSPRVALSTTVMRFIDEYLSLFVA